MERGEIYGSTFRDETHLHWRGWHNVSLRSPSQSPRKTRVNYDGTRERFRSWKLKNFCQKPVSKLEFVVVPTQVLIAIIILRPTAELLMESVIHVWLAPSWFTAAFGLFSFIVREDLIINESHKNAWHLMTRQSSTIVGFKWVKASGEFCLCGGDKRPPAAHKLISKT